MILHPPQILRQNSGPFTDQGGGVYTVVRFLESTRGQQDGSRWVTGKRREVAGFYKRVQCVSLCLARAQIQANQVASKWSF